MSIRQFRIPKWPQFCKFEASSGKNVYIMRFQCSGPESSDWHPLLMISKVISLVLLFHSWHKSPGFVEFISNIEQFVFMTTDSGAKMSIDGFHFLNLINQSLFLKDQIFQFHESFWHTQNHPGAIFGCHLPKRLVHVIIEQFQTHYLTVRCVRTFYG